MKEENNKLEKMAENVLSELCIAQTGVIIPKGDSRHKYVQLLTEKGYAKEDKKLSDSFEATKEGYDYFRKNN